VWQLMDVTIQPYAEQRVILGHCSIEFLKKSHSPYAMLKLKRMQLAW
jgi:hypothetical protein